MNIKVNFPLLMMCFGRVHYTFECYVHFGGQLPLLHSSISVLCCDDEEFHVASSSLFFLPGPRRRSGGQLLQHHNSNITTLKLFPQFCDLKEIWEKVNCVANKEVKIPPC